MSTSLHSGFVLCFFLSCDPWFLQNFLTEFNHDTVDVPVVAAFDFVKLRSLRFLSTRTLQGVPCLEAYR